MISITKNEIQALLTGYQISITQNKKRSPFRSATGRLPAIIIALNDFIKNASSNDQLTPEELYTLTALLLDRKIRRNLLSGEAKLSEKLAQAIEAKFEKPRMDCFCACRASNALDQAIFNFICAAENLETLPKKPEDVRPWLESNSLLSPLEMLFNQPEKNAQLIPYLSNQALSTLSQVNKGFHGLFKPVLDAQQLGQLIICADLDNAKKMIQVYPSLLTIPVTVTDSCGRKIQGTALQLALGAEDVRCHDGEIAMVEMIMGELEKQPNGERIIAQQIVEQLPEGWDVAHQERVERDKIALDAFVDAVASSNNLIDWEAAAEVYRNHIENENLEKGVIKTGLHCNAQLVAAWFDACKADYAVVGDSRLKNAFLREKGGQCRHYLTASYRMQLVRGRKVNFLHGVGTFFPLDTAPPAGRPVGVGPLQALHDGLLEKAGLKQTSLWLFSYANQKILTLKNLRESAIQTLKQNRIT